MVEVINLWANKNIPNYPNLLRTAALTPCPLTAELVPVVLFGNDLISRHLIDSFFSWNFICKMSKFKGKFTVCYF